MTQPNPTVKCIRCHRGIEYDQIRHKVREWGIHEKDIVKYNLKLLCDECCLIAVHKTRWVETLIFAMLLGGIIVIMLWRML